MSHAARYLAEVGRIAAQIYSGDVERMVDELAALRARGGRLFLAGLGGSAANCSHAAADFRTLCGIEAMAADSMAELTAGANDEGWPGAFQGLMRFARAGDALMVLSVGGGAGVVSVPLLQAVNRAKLAGISVFGLVGRDGGYVKERGDCVIVVPTVEASRVTPHTEAFQMVLIHCLVSHPLLQQRPTKW